MGCVWLGGLNVWIVWFMTEGKFVFVLLWLTVVVSWVWYLLV